MFLFIKIYIILSFITAFVFLQKSEKKTSSSCSSESGSDKKEIKDSVRSFLGLENC